MTLPFWFDGALQTVGMPHREVSSFSHSMTFAPLRLIHTWGGYHIVRLGPNLCFCYPVMQVAISIRAGEEQGSGQLSFA